MKLIELDRISKVFGGSATPSVDDLSLTVHDGELLCLLGPSGCGKSTTLRMIAGLETVSSGRISIRGTAVDDVAAGIRVGAEHRDLGLVFQNYALWPHLTVRDNVAFGPRMKRLPEAQRRDVVTTALRRLAIEDYAERYPSELSGGQQQRVAIARTLAAEPSVLLLDEPLSNLDARLRLEMRSEFQRLHRDLGATMVFVTHDQWEAMTMATRIVVMNEGRIEQSGTPLDIYQHPQTRFVAEFMGSPPINMIETGDLAIGIRPESLNVLNVEMEPTVLPGDSMQIPTTVTAVLPTGGTWITELHDGTRQLFATSTRRPEVAPGDSTIAWAHHEDLHLFDPTGARVERESAPPELLTPLDRKHALHD